MPNPVDLALVSLLPHVSYPPEELQSLTTSLLTQSRARAPRLKADEEVARTYVCAHIACERLQSRLGLEIGKDVRPPCPPRVYTRLKGFLGGLLETSQHPQQQKQQRGSGRVRGAENESTTATTPKKSTNLEKTPATTPTVTLTAGRKRTISEVEEGGEKEHDELPRFTSPLLAYVCAACKVSAHAVERTRAGAAEVLKEISSRRKVETDNAESTSRRRRGRTTPRAAAVKVESTASQNVVVPESRWPALLAALLICTLAKMRDLGIDAEEMQSMREKVVGAVVKFCTENQSVGSEGWSSQVEDELDKTVSFYLLEAGDCGWLDMQWYQEIASDRADVEVEAEEEEEEQATPVKTRKQLAKTPLRRKEKHGGIDGSGMVATAAGLLPGLGTMFQPAVDWLSDERRAQYVQWKKGILAAIE